MKLIFVFYTGAIQATFFNFLESVWNDTAGVGNGLNLVVDSVDSVWQYATSFFVETPLNSGFLSKLGMEYGDNEYVEWKIGKNCTWVEMKVEVFDIERGYDFLNVGEKAYSGSLERDFIPDTIGHEAPVKIVFVSDRSNSGNSGDFEGFRISWQCSEPPETQTRKVF